MLPLFFHLKINPGVLVQAATLINNSSGESIADSYVVILKKGHSADTFQTRFNGITRQQNGHGRPSIIHRKYSKIPGFAATLGPAALKEILASPGANLDWTQPYLYNDAAGLGVTAFVLDTGVYAAAHTDFGGRASLGANFVTGSANTDENGHGTHVAGTIGGTKYGVAKKVQIVGVKVLDANGAGTTSGILAGLDWVIQHATVGKAVVNMSLGGGKSQAIDNAADHLYAANIPLIVAAGGSSQGACSTSPSGSPNTYKVAATDKADHVASVTALGPCVEIFAPGVEITSTWIGSVSASNILTGTSMASPHAAGVAALYLSFNTLLTAQAVFDKLTITATNNKIIGNLQGAPNKLVHNGGP
ncbi:hypothetical protein EMPS_04024 [Entomortierella parvispora]|uniref:Peptidase S8/S53 domain-containing protein n=1 Tax=Entomortierella parvispora TaxID=205924 RepID=A0A9P3H7V1_9FUNG|nr:hypothetical protein EMPS_04024 [Entomortierella parvispora]